jgi:hypothetical protein
MNISKLNRPTEKEKIYRDTWNFIRERLGLCPIEKVERGKNQNIGVIPEEREEMTLERFKEKWRKKK